MRMRRVAGLCVFLASLASGSLASERQTEGPALIVSGLIMVSVDGPESLQIVVPEAPGHNATISIVGRNGDNRVLPLAKGVAMLTALAPGTTKPVVRLPELVRARELYGGDVRVRLTDARTIVSVPWPAVAGVSAASVTRQRYTFVSADTGEEVQTFRPRQIAESIRIDLTSTGNLKIGKNAPIDFGDAKEIHIDYSPKNPHPDQFEEHFQHYLHYLELPTGRINPVRPQSMSPAQAHLRRHPMINALFPPYYFCYTMGI